MAGCVASRTCEAGIDRRAHVRPGRTSRQISLLGFMFSPRPLDHPRGWLMVTRDWRDQSCTRFFFFLLRLRCRVLCIIYQFSLVYYRVHRTRYRLNQGENHISVCNIIIGKCIIPDRCRTQVQSLVYHTRCWLNQKAAYSYLTEYQISVYSE